MFLLFTFWNHMHWVSLTMKTLQYPEVYLSFIHLTKVNYTMKNIIVFLSLSHKLVWLQMGKKCLNHNTTKCKILVIFVWFCALKFHYSSVTSAVIHFFFQIYKGPETTFQISNLQLNCEYRFRVCAIRQCQGTQGFHDLVGPYSATVTLYSQRNETPTSNSKDTTEATKTAQTLSDEQCAALILALFAVVSVLIAFIVQYFVIKWKVLSISVSLCHVLLVL